MRTASKTENKTKTEERHKGELENIFFPSPSPVLITIKPSL